MSNSCIFLPASIMVVIGLLATTLIHAQTIWSGPSVTFSKANYADWTLEINQDRLTDSVWITRADMRGIFNFVQESAYDQATNASPVGTEWANGSLSDGIENLDFGTWFESNANGPSETGVPKVVHLIAEDIYFDILFTEWAQGADGSGTGFGGGFTYTRSSPDPTTAASSPEKGTPIQIFPNPANGHLHIVGVTTPINYEILSVNGSLIQSGKTNIGDPILIAELQCGVHFLKLKGFVVIPFVKI